MTQEMREVLWHLQRQAQRSGFFMCTEANARLPPGGRYFEFQTCKCCSKGSQAPALLSESSAVSTGEALSSGPAVCHAQEV